MKKNLNVVVEKSLKTIKYYKPEGTTVEEAIIIYRANRMNAKWLSQRFSLDILSRIVKDRNKHGLNEVQLRNIKGAVKILKPVPEVVNIPKQKKSGFRAFLGI